MPELRRFSHSLIDTYLECPRKAFYRYVEGIESPKTSALVTGSACDAIAIIVDSLPAEGCSCYGCSERRRAARRVK